MSQRHPCRRLIPVLGALLLVGAGRCPAVSLYTISLNTSPLIGSLNGPFSLDFQLTDGSGTNDGNNTATLSGFSFGGGAAAGAATTTGGAAGSLTSGLTLTDTSFVNELFQPFTPGSSLAFTLALTGSPDVGPTPDEFSFAVLDKTGAEIPTAAASGGFLSADITPRGVVTQTSAGTGTYAAIAAPTLRPGAAPVPEPGTLSLLGAGLALPLLCRRRRR